MTTEELETLGIEHLVSKFTTYHDCCEARVDNIHLIADEVDGAIVPPDGQFWLNDYVGERTAEEGYKEAGAIIGGVVVDDNLGGGISQFTTTLYNAVFWGGYLDVSHTPHSFWFSRYPQGVEATLSWPSPDLAFGNNGSCGVLIRTEYSDTSITVRLYGCNGGRSLVGEHIPGDRTADVYVATEGNGESKVVEATTGEPYGFTDPTTTVYEGNSGLAPGDERRVSDGTQGFSVDVVRTITFPDGTEDRGHLDLALPTAADRGGTAPLPPPARVRGLHGRALPGAPDHDDLATRHDPTATGHDPTAPRHHRTTNHSASDNRAVKGSRRQTAGGGQSSRCGPRPFLSVPPAGGGAQLRSSW